MRELVRLAEVREARAKQEMAALLAERAEVFDAADGLTARGDPAEAAAVSQPAEQAQQEPSMQCPVAAAEPAAQAEPGEAEAEAEQDEAEVQQDGAAQQAGPVAAAAAVPLPAGSSVQEGDVVSSQEATASSAATPSQDEESTAKSFALAEQEAGQASAAANDAASGPASAPSLPAKAAAAAAAHAAAVNPDLAAEQQLLQHQMAIAEARRRQQTAKEKFSKLSQVCVAADQVR